MTARPWILLPVEIKAREFHAKVLQAAVAAERGFDVVIGEQNALQRALVQLPRGVIIDKSVDRSKAAIFRRAQGLGFRVASWCEEGLVYRDRDTYLHERVYNESLAPVERFFAWGEVQRGDMMLKAPEAAAKIRVTGHPRFDLLRPDLRAVYDAEVADIRRRYGRYILVATNFSRFNHFMGYDFSINVLRQRGTIASDEQLAFFRRWRDYIEVLYRGFVAALPALRKAFPDHAIIVRPHPSENHDQWCKEVAGLSDVTVAFESSAIPWIAGCDVLLHNSCTTGVEAYLLDRPVVAYRPTTDAVLDSHLPHALSQAAATVEELIAMVATALDGMLSPPGAAAAEAARYVAAIHGTWAAERVVDELSELAIAPAEYRAGLAARMRGLVGQVRHVMAGPVRRLRMGRGFSDYARQKNPGVSATEITEFLHHLRTASGRFGAVTMAPLPVRECFRISLRR